MTAHPPFDVLAARSIDGWLTESEQDLFDQHVRGCATCRHLLAGLRDDQARLAAVPSIETSPELRRRVMAAARRPAVWNGWLLLAAALLVVVATFGVVVVQAYLARQSTRTSVELTSDWQILPVEGQGEASTSRVNDVVGTPAGFVAVGSADGRAAVWTTRDGSRWQRTADPPGGDGAELDWVVTGGPGFIAGGRAGSGPAIWTSVDGRAWRAAGPESAFPQAVVNVIRPLDGGWLAAGAAIGPVGLTGATWTSEDGVTWVANVPSVPEGAGVNYLGNLDVIYRRPGGGWVARSLNSYTQQFASADGRHWTPDPARSAAEVTSVRTLGAVLVAVERGKLVWSADGNAWSSASVEPQDVGSFTSFSETRGGIVAIGTSARGPILAASEDGRSYTLTDAPLGSGGTRVYAFARTATVDVAVGIDGGEEAIWARAR